MSLPVAGADAVQIPLPTPFMDSSVNVYLLKGDPLILIDTGPRSDEAYGQLVKALKKNGVSVRDIEVILVTHGHLDHIGLLAQLIEESGAQAYAHPHAAARSASYNTDTAENIQFYVQVFAECGTPQEAIDTVAANQTRFQAYGEQADIPHVLDDGATVAYLTACHVPGHSSSDTLLVDNSKQVAYVGDHLLKTVNPNPLLRRPAPGKPRPKSLVEYTQSLQRTRAMNLDWCCPGHGEPFRDHRQVIDRMLKRFQERGARVLACLSNGPMTPYQLCACLYPKLDPQSLFLGLSVAVGHLEVLESEGAVAPENRNGILYYRKTSTPRLGLRP